MAVEVNSTRKAVEISWDPSGQDGGGEPEAPEGFPEHPIYLPGEPTHPIAPGGEAPDNTLPGEQPGVDNTLPGDQPRPDQGLPGEQPGVDNTLPGDQPRPDQGLPGEQPGVEQPIFLPPYVDNTLPGSVRAALREHLTGNLPDYVAPHDDGGVSAVQIFAQGMEGDWSNGPVIKNDGLGVLTYPKDFKGTSYVEVRGLDGTLVDYGEIEVK